MPSRAAGHQARGGPGKPRGPVPWGPLRRLFGTLTPGRTLSQPRATLWRHGTGFSRGRYSRRGRRVPCADTRGPGQGERGCSRRRLLSGLLRQSLVLSAGGLLTACATAPAASPPALPAWQGLGIGLWWLPGAAAMPDAHNRGLVANLLAVRAGGGLWLIGSGPSPALGRRLAQTLTQAAGQPVTDLVNPWAHPALVLGNSAWLGAAPAAQGQAAGAVRGWVHAQVAQALRQQCPRCVARLRAQLGPAASDLGDTPLHLPEHLLQDVHGLLAQGQLRWRLVDRGAASVATLWAVPAARCLFAPGLLWTGGPPDLADAGLQALQAATATVLAELGPGWHALGQQGPPGTADDVHAQAHYLHALADAVRQRQAAGALETEEPAALRGVSAAWQRLPVHALNWQRAWRSLEDETLGPATAASAQARR